MEWRVQRFLLTLWWPIHALHVAASLHIREVTGRKFCDCPYSSCSQEERWLVTGIKCLFRLQFSATVTPSTDVWCSPMWQGHGELFLDFVGKMLSPFISVLTALPQVQPFYQGERYHNSLSVLNPDCDWSGCSVLTTGAIHAIYFHVLKHSNTESWRPCL